MVDWFFNILENFLSFVCSSPPPPSTSVQLLHSSSSLRFIIVIDSCFAMLFFAFDTRSLEFMHEQVIICTGY
jgi:hypothetical protein